VGESRRTLGSEPVLRSRAMSRVDLVVVGDVYTVDAARTWAQAVAVAGDRIVAVGTESEVRERVGAAAEVVRGACILPGFQDAHVHPSVAGRNLLNVNLDDLRGDREAYLDRIAAFALEHPDLEWIVGGGWFNVAFPSAEGPRKEDLDRVAPGRAVFLLNNDVHAAWVSSRALEVAGIRATTPDPWDGYFVRDPDGTPTGCLQEGAAYAFLRDVVPRPDPSGWMECLRVAQRELLALGITGWQDAWVEPDLLQAYRALDDTGELTARVVTALWWDRHRGVEQFEDLVEQRDAGNGTRLHAGTVKIMLDGCPESCMAAMLDPYEGAFGDAHGTGIAFVEPGPLKEALIRLDAAGFQVHQHALGDRAIRIALDAVQAAREANGPNDARHHVAHLQFPAPEDIPRLRRLGVVANMQPFWAQPDPMIELLTEPRVGDRIARLYPMASINAGGSVMAFGSDWPVSTPNPWLELEIAVTRATPGGDPDRVLDREQRVDLHTGIAAFARGSSYVNHDDDAGSLEEGKRADLVVLDRNPFEEGPIGQTRVVTTIVGGTVVHQAE
jgi:predicted amidohydrolase YtcJ